MCERKIVNRKVSERESESKIKQKALGVDTDEGDSVHISTRREEDGVVLVICDE